MTEYERELARIRAEQEHEDRMAELARLGQEMGLYDYPERLQADDPDDFRASMTMWALMALAAVGFAIWVM